MNLDKIFRTLTTFLNEYDLPDGYVSAFPHEEYPSATLIYSDTHGDDLTNELLWKPTKIGGESASITFNGLTITVLTYWTKEDES